MSYPKHKTKANVLNATDKKIIRVAVYTLGTLTVGSALFFLGRHVFRKTASNKEQNLSLNDNTESNLAKRLKMAFDNDGFWGTDVEAVRKVFVDVVSKESFAKVIKSYKTLYTKNLVEDLTDELTTTEYYEMQNILASKPQKTGEHQVFDYTVAKSYAKRLNAAVNYKVMNWPATDEAAIQQVITEIPNQQVWQLTKLAYQKEYGVSLEDELNEDLGVFDYDWKEMIKKKPIK